MNEGNQIPDNSDDPRVDQEVIDWLENLANMLKGEHKQCLSCGAKIEDLEQIGRSVYARPCGHRQYQGRVPDTWK